MQRSAAVDQYLCTVLLRLTNHRSFHCKDSSPFLTYTITETTIEVDELQMKEHPRPDSQSEEEEEEEQEQEEQEEFAARQNKSDSCSRIGDTMNRSKNTTESEPKAGVNARQVN